MLKPLFLVGIALAVGGLAYVFSRGKSDSFDPNAPGTIVDQNGARWAHWVDELEIHHAEPEEQIYAKVYGGQPSYNAETHDVLVDMIVTYADKHPLPVSVI
jgi:hypothetical protein